MNDEQVRQCVRIITQKFLGWRIPPIELPAESVIEEAVKEIVASQVDKLTQEHDAALAEVARLTGLIKELNVACGAWKARAFSGGVEMLRQQVTEHLAWLESVAQDHLPDMEYWGDDAHDCLCVVCERRRMIATEGKADA